MTHARNHANHVEFDEDGKPRRRQARPTAPSGLGDASQSRQDRHDMARDAIPAADFSNWRPRLRVAKMRELTDEDKQRYLEKLSQTGKVYIAARAACLHYHTVTKQMEMDEEFNELVDAALKHYNEHVEAIIEQDALRDPEATQLRVMLLKASNRERYSDKTNLDVTFKGGAVVVPLTPTADEWEKQFANHSSNYILPDTSDVITNAAE